MSKVRAIIKEPCKEHYIGEVDTETLAACNDRAYVIPDMKNIVLLSRLEDTVPTLMIAAPRFVVTGKFYAVSERDGQYESLSDEDLRKLDFYIATHEIYYKMSISEAYLLLMQMKDLGFWKDEKCVELK